MLLSNNWKDYELLDTSDGEKLERFGEFIMIRPDPQIIWQTPKTHVGWRTAHMHYHRSSHGGGSWEVKRKVPERWTISYEDIKFHIRPTDFKHVGIFPEQAVNWQWTMQKIREANRPIKVLNLFAYTGGATVAALSAGASVCHLDAAKAMNQWAKDNVQLSGLSDSSARYITDDVIKFVQREKRRENYYDAIIMDPPSYGRGPNGEIWKLEAELYGLIKNCADILTDNPLFMLVNSYTTGLSPMVIENILRAELLPRFKGQENAIVTSGEIGIPSSTGFVLPCGIYGRYENK